eukprot:16227_1
MSLQKPTSGTVLEKHGISLTEDERKELQEIFNLVDTDRGGSISKEELKQLMDTLGIHASQEEIDLMINEIDQNNDGEIQFDEFVAVMSRKVNANYTAEEVIEAFQIFEGDAPSGHISLDSLKGALSTYGTNKLTTEKALKLINQIECNKQGLFDYREYVNMMMSD